MLNVDKCRTFRSCLAHWHASVECVEWPEMALEERNSRFSCFACFLALFMRLSFPADASWLTRTTRSWAMTLSTTVSSYLNSVRRK